MKLPSFFKGFSPLWWWGFLMTKHMTQIICHISRLGYCATKYHHKTNVWQYDLFMPLFIGHYNCCCPLLASIDKEQKGGLLTDNKSMIGKNMYTPVVKSSCFLSNSILPYLLELRGMELKWPVVVLEKIL